MANLKSFESLGGLSVDQTSVVDFERNLRNVNSLEVKNSNFENARTTNYVLTGTDTIILSLDTTAESIVLRQNSLNFINTYIAGVNATGAGFLTKKLESAITCNSVGLVQALSTMETVVKDSIPTGEAWEVVPYTSGAAYRFSYSASKSGVGPIVKWFAYVQVVSIDWT